MNLTKDQSDRAMALGQNDARGLLDDIKSRVQGFDSQDEKLLWWVAFMSYISGICAAELAQGQ